MNQERSEKDAATDCAALREKTQQIKNEITEIEEMAVKRYGKYLWFFPLYIIGYILVERFPIVTQYHEVHCAADDLIPFCEYFVVAYYLWHVVILLFSIHTLRLEPSRFERLIRFFIVCSLMVFPIFLLYPSCQNLRPVVFPRENLFTDLVRCTYMLDTNTNVTPSMHVVGCFGLLFSCWNIKGIDNGKWRSLQVILFLLICASTVFLKQHSLIDVIAAVPVGLAGWWVSGKHPDPAAGGRLKEILSVIFVRGKVFTLPNIMSMFRLFLIPVIIRAYVVYENPYLATGLVVLSGVTDIADGYVARHFHQMSDLGKILDPVADKLTQLALIAILTDAYPSMRILIGIILFKEVAQGVLGYLMLKRHRKVHGSQWFGKLSTLLLYATAISLILFNRLPAAFADVAVGVCAGGLILALVLYARFYLRELYPDQFHPGHSQPRQIFPGHSHKK